MKNLFLILEVIFIFILSISFAVASDGTGAAGVSGQALSLIGDKAFVGGLSVIGVGIAAFGCGIGEGLIASKALEGISRNPSATDKIFTPMILTLAFVESLVIFTIVTIFLVK